MVLLLLLSILVAHPLSAQPAPDSYDVPISIGVLRLGMPVDSALEALDHRSQVPHPCRYSANGPAECRYSFDELGNPPMQGLPLEALTLQVNRPTERLSSIRIELMDDASYEVVRNLLEDRWGAPGDRRSGGTCHHWGDPGRGPTLCRGSNDGMSIELSPPDGFAEAVRLAEPQGERFTGRLDWWPDWRSLRVGGARAGAPARIVFDSLGIRESTAARCRAGEDTSREGIRPTRTCYWEDLRISVAGFLASAVEIEMDQPTGHARTLDFRIGPLPRDSAESAAREIRERLAEAWDADIDDFEGMMGVIRGPFTAEVDAFCARACAPGDPWQVGVRLGVPFVSGFHQDEAWRIRGDPLYRG